MKFHFIVHFVSPVKQPYLFTTNGTHFTQKHPYVNFSIEYGNLCRNGFIKDLTEDLQCSRFMKESQCLWSCFYTLAH